MVLLGTRGMKPCPHDLAAWQCTYYVWCAGYRLCQDKRRRKLSEEEDKKYCNLCATDCDGYEIDKRFKGADDD